MLVGFFFYIKWFLLLKLSIWYFNKYLYNVCSLMVYFDWFFYMFVKKIELVVLIYMYLLVMIFFEEMCVRLIVDFWFLNN